MTSSQLLPTLMIIEGLIASFIYFYGGDIKMGCYWLFASCLTSSLTYL